MEESQEQNTKPNEQVSPPSTLNTESSSSTPPSRNKKPLVFISLAVVGMLLVGTVLVVAVINNSTQTESEARRSTLQSATPTPSPSLSADEQAIEEINFGEDDTSDYIQIEQDLQNLY